MKQIVVVGGGTAGWLTALWAETHFRGKVKVSLIESERIGIIRAGEGTVPSIVPFLEQLNIDPLELIAKTNGSIKVASVFANWNGDNKSYYHDFLLDYKWNDLPEHFNHYYLNAKNKTQWFEFISNHNKVPFNSDRITRYSLHFDGVAVGEFLRGKAEERGIRRIEGVVNGFDQSTKGIEKIYLENGQQIPCDFVFDCSGFARLIIGKLFKTRWIDYSEYLPVNSAIPFFPKRTENHIEPYTTATAMGHGWGWRVPLYHRFGAGYVYCSDTISDDEAKKELDDSVGYEVESPKTFRFSAGTYDKIWVKNCIAIGLAQGFLEPLEASALWIVTGSLERLTDFVPFLFDPKPRMMQRYNDHISKGSESAMAFIFYHYITKRKDTEFWKHMSNLAENKPPPLLETLLGDAKNMLIDETSIEQINNSSLLKFDLSSYIQLGINKGILDKKLYLEYLSRVDPHGHVDRMYDEYYQFMQKEIVKYPNHLEFLNQIRNKHGIVS